MTFYGAKNRLLLLTQIKDWMLVVSLLLAKTRNFFCRFLKSFPYFNQICSFFLFWRIRVVRQRFNFLLLAEKRREEKRGEERRREERREKRREWGGSVVRLYRRFFYKFVICENLFTFFHSHKLILKFE